MIKLFPGLVNSASVSDLPINIDRFPSNKLSSFLSLVFFVLIGEFKTVELARSSKSGRKQHLKEMKRRGEEKGDREEGEIETDEARSGEEW